jgi:hypothetical protein
MCHSSAATTVRPGTVILHFKDDEVVPYADSENGLPEDFMPVGMEQDYE